MSNSPWTDEGTLPPAVELRVNRVCNRFEAAWQAAGSGGPRPVLEHYVGEAAEGDRPALLRELIKVDVCYRRLRGEGPRPDDYRARFPDLPGDWLARVVGECPPPAPPPPTSPRPAPGQAGDTPPLSTPSALRIRCPHCQNPLRLADDRSDEVLCPACGSTFRVHDTRQTTTTSAMRQLGKFQLLERVGLGAFGAVWRARDTELGRPVALKVPHASLLTAAGDRERFYGEARAAAALRHPGIVTVHEVATLEGLPAIVADFIEGVTLRDLLGMRRLTFRESAEVIAQVAEALDYAHGRGVVHRDIKPANIMLDAGPVSVRAAEGDGATGAPPPSGLRAMVMDFGLARRDEVTTTLTVEGQILGTPAYMSPEQAAGAGHRADRRSDVYSLGVVLFELLVGELPFRGNTRMIVYQVLHEEPRPPRRINDKVPRDLETICLKCLEKEPARRYPTAGALAADLRRFRKGEPIQARPVGPLEKGWKWANRHRAIAGLLAGIVTLFLVGFALVTWLWLGAEDARQKEKAQALAEAKAREQAASAEAEKWRTTLANYHTQADACLAAIRALDHATDRPDVLQEVLDQFRRVGTLRDEATRAMRQLGDPFRALVPEEERRWQERADLLRNEATRWLAGIRLQRGRSIRLPEGSEEGDIPAVALRADLQQVAVLYPGSTALWVLGPDGQTLNRLTIPERVARKARTTETVVREGLLTRSTTRDVHTGPYRFEYVGANRLEYQVGPEALSWTLPEGTLREEQRPDRVPEGLPTTPRATDQYLALLAHDSNAAVSLREWAPGAKPRVVWQIKDQRDTGRHDGVTEVGFGADGRALFIRSTARLAVVDPASGAAAEEPLADDQEKEVKAGNLIPCRGGIALVKRRKEQGRYGPPQLVFWNADLPLVRLRNLRHDDLPVGLDWAADGLLVTGGADHLVRAWRGGNPAWASGIPYLGRDQDGVRDRLPTVNLPPEDLYPTKYNRRDVRTVQRGWQRLAWSPGDPGPEEFLGYARPLPYSRWLFGRTAAHNLIVERRELLSGGRSRVRREVYAPEDGRLLYAFPTEGKGRVLPTDDAVSPDGRFAVVVSEESNSLGTLEVWSLDDHRSLGRLGRYPLPEEDPVLREDPPVHADFEATAGKDWLLLARRLESGAGAELEVWRLPEVTLVGKLPVPIAMVAARPTGEGHRALLGNTALAVPFKQVIDLEKARKVCDLQGYERATRRGFSLLAGSKLVESWRGDGDVEPYHVSAWDLKTGRRTDLGLRPWSNSEEPEKCVSLREDRLLVCGNLHENGMAHVELWDLARTVLLREATFPTRGRPWIIGVQELYGLVAVPDFPERGTSRTLSWKWSDGSDMDGPGPGARLERWHLDRAFLARRRWLLWRDGTGLALQREAGRQKVPLEKTAFPLTRVVAPAGDGRTLALEGKGGGLWETATGRQVVAFPPDHRCRDFDPTGRWALTVSRPDGEIWVWDTETGKPACRCRPAEAPEGGFDPATAELKLHPGGKRLAALSRGVLRLWDLERNGPVLSLERPGHFAPVTCVAQHAGAGLVASANEEGLILLWNRDDGRLVRVLDDDPAGAVALAFSPEGGRLASASSRGTVTLWELPGRRAWSAPASGPGAAITRLAFHPSRPLLLATTRDGRLVLLDPKTGNRLADKPIDTTELQSLALSPDGDLLALGSRGGRVHLWDFGRGEVRRSWDTLAPVSGLAFLGGPELLATGGQAVQFWETRTGRNVWTLEAPRGPVRALVLNDGTGELAVADQGESVLVVNLPDLHARLEQLRLGCPTFPAPKWPGAAPTPDRPGPLRWQDWQRRAEGLFQNGEWSAALAACARAIERQPGRWQVWDLRATASARLLQPGRSEPWVPDFMPAPELRATLWTDWTHAADIRTFLHGSRQGWHEGHGSRRWRADAVAAVADYTQALVLNPDNGPVCRRRARVHLWLGRWREAADDYTKSLERDAPEPEALFGRGLARYHLHQDDLALADFTQALQLDPGHAWAPLLRCEALRRQKDYDGAIAESTDLLRRDPLAAPARAIRGAARRDKGDLREALVDLDEAIRLDPDSPYARAQRGELYRQLGQPEQAVADLQQAVVLDTRYATPYAVLGLIHRAKNDHARAVSDFDEALRLDPQLGPAYHPRGRAHLALGHLDRAIADFDEAIRRRPDEAILYNDRGLAYLKKREFAKALADYDKATALAPKLVYPFYNRGELYREQRDFGKAVPEYTRAIELKPDHLGSWRDRGRAHAELGEWDKAAADFARAAELAPGDAWLPFARALILLGRGDHKRYRTACRDLLEHFGHTTDPGTASLVCWAGVLAPGAAEDVPPYLRLVTEAAAARPQSYVFAYTLGAALYRAGRFEDAARTLAEADRIHAAGGTPYDWLLLAMTHAHLGHRDEARKWLDKAVRRIDQAWRDPSDKGTAGEVYDWQARLELQVLRREAEDLVKKGP